VENIIGVLGNAKMAANLKMIWRIKITLSKYQGKESFIAAGEKLRRS